MKLVIPDNQLEYIDMNPDSVSDEITQNVAVILATPAGSVPLDRGLGQEMNYLDMPANFAKRQMMIDLSSALTEFEPRASLDEILLAKDEEDGTDLVTVSVTYSEEDEE